MPAVSKKQERFMQAVAHNPAFAKKAGVPQSVGKEFTKAGGGMANTSRMNRLEELGRVDSEKAKTFRGKKNLAEEKKRIVGEMKYAKGGMTESKSMVKKEVSFMKSKGAPKSMIKHEESEMKKMSKGGVAPTPMGKVRTAAPSRDGVAEKGKTKGKMVVMAGSSKGMRKGGKC
jgi:hypothetical protein